MLGKIIRDARLELGISQQLLASFIGKTTRSYISAIELDIELPSIITFKELCKVLKLDEKRLGLIYREEKALRYKENLNKKMKVKGYAKK